MLIHTQTTLANRLVAQVSTGESLLAATLVLCHGLQWVYGSGPDLWPLGALHLHTFTLSCRSCWSFSVFAAFALRLRRLVGFWTDRYEDCLSMLRQGRRVFLEVFAVPASTGSKREETPRITKEESSQLAMVVVVTGTTCTSSALDSGPCGYCERSPRTVVWREVCRL